MRAGRWTLLLAAWLAPTSVDGKDLALRAGDPDDPLAYAAVDTWPMQDACPARTRATRTPALLDATRVAWTFEAPGPIEGDPRVWGEWVVVASQQDGKSHLDVLRLSDGKTVVPRKTYAHGARLSPVLWQDIVFVRGKGGIEVLRIVPELRMLSDGKGFPGADDVLLLPGGELIVVDGSGVSRRRLGQDEPIWSTDVLDGTAVSLRGKFLYGFETQEREGYKKPELFLVRLRLADGGKDRAWKLAWADAGHKIVVGADDVLAAHDDVDLVGSGSASGSRVSLQLADIRPSLVRLVGNPVAWGPHLFFHQTLDDLGVSLCRPAKVEDAADLLAARDGLGFYVLAGGQRHDAFRAAAPDGIASGGVVFAAGGAYDAESHRVLTAYPRRRGPVIPARETMLAVDGRRLEALRVAGPTSAQGPVVAGSGPPLASPKGTLVALDGAVRIGALSSKGATVSVGGKSIPWSDVGLVTDAEGALRHGPSGSFVVRGLPRAVRQQQKAEWTALARRAAGSRSAAALAQAIADLVEHGGRQDDVVIPLLRELTRIEKGVGALEGPDAARVAEVTGKRRALLAAEATGIWRAFSSLPETVPATYRFDLLRAVLEADPAQPDAVAWLKAHLPEGVATSGEFDAPEWLEVVEAAGQSALRGIAAKTAGPEMTDDERTLAAARAKWRPDLVGLRSDRLLLVTPVTKPGRIARCLSLGELVCTALDREFGVQEGSPDADPLVVHLYETQEEYLKQSSNHGGWVEWTSGHYSPGEALSRLFVPAGRDAFARMMSVLAHELTHHWLDQRLPVPSHERSACRPGTPGYFLEEGFATLVEEFGFDLRERLVKTFDARADSLDSVASSPKLLDWEQVLSMSQAEFHDLAREDWVEVPSRWTLGQSRRMSSINLFYAQSAAICHFLHDADEGKRRAALLQWVKDFHANRTEGDDVAARVGMSPKALGEAVLRWSREVSARGE